MCIRDSFRTDDKGIALFGAVRIDDALHGVIQHVDHVLLFHLHTLLRHHVDCLQFFLGVSVIGVLFKASLNGVQLFLHFGLKSFKVLHPGLSGFAVTHDARHIHDRQLGLGRAFALLAGNKHQAQQQGQRHKITDSHGNGYSSQNCRVTLNSPHGGRCV